MNTVYVKIHTKNNNKYRKMLSVDEDIYSSIDELLNITYEYDTRASLDIGEWFVIKNASKQPFAIDIIQKQFDSLDFDLLTKADFSQIEYLFIVSDKYIFFQNIGKSKLVSKKSIISFGESFKYRSDSEEIVVNDLPDAIYDNKKDILYFKKIESIVRIFKGIINLYKEATDEETEQFLKSNFLTLKDGYGVANVKTANRKRIALANDTLSKLNNKDKRNIFLYIKDYCPKLYTKENTFSVSNENELKMVLFGIEQRFYTTPIGKERRVALSVSSI